MKSSIIKNEKCWANSLGDCDRTITKEHLVSKTLLGESTVVSGLPWCRKEEKKAVLRV